MTSLPMILAEELDADWSKVNVKVFDKHDKRYGNKLFGNLLYTAGSGTLYGYYDKLRLGGAQARRVLLEIAAQRWAVPVGELETEPSIVVHSKSGRRISYGELAKAENIPTGIAEVTEADFKPKANYRLVGTDVPRLDIPEKVDGSAIYGIDVQVPNMHYAVVLRAPVEGSTPENIDQTASLLVPGITNIVPLAHGVGIVGTNLEAAIQARSLLKVKWSESPASKFSSEDALAKYRAAAKDFSQKGNALVDKGDTEGAMAKASQIFEAEYQTDYAYHAQMEPINATASVNDTGDAAEIWVGTQTQSLSILKAAGALKTTPDKITLHPTYLGGGFGRRAQMEFLVEAVLLSKASKKPVKVIWSREDDIKHGHFRPITAHNLRAGLDENGNISAWHHRVAAPSVLEFFNPGRWKTAGGKDILVMKDTDLKQYDLPNMKVEHVIVERQAQIAPYRAIGAGSSKFAIESFLDELAIHRKMDPVDLRMELCQNSPQLQIIIKTLTELCDWNRPRKGTALGLSVAGYSAPAAGVAEISVDDNTGIIKVHNFWAVVDPDYVVSPDNTLAQIEGGIIFGLSQALKERVTMKDGMVEQSNFHDYPVLRMSEAPNIQIKVFSSPDKSPYRGIGEIGVPMTGAAIANAFAALTGKRIRHLPLTPDRVKEALES